MRPESLACRYRGHGKTLEYRTVIALFLTQSTCVQWHALSAGVSTEWYATSGRRLTDGSSASPHPIGGRASPIRDVSAEDCGSLLQVHRSCHMTLRQNCGTRGVFVLAKRHSARAIDYATSTLGNSNDVITTMYAGHRTLYGSFLRFSLPGCRSRGLSAYPASSAHCTQVEMLR